ncbi:MAG: type II toxin-antitoxin system RelE/ParE family toxin [Pseudomonadota bacterium]
MKRYVLRPRAEADLADIWRYGVAQWSAKQADTYYVTLTSAFLRLSEMPDLGRPYDDLRHGYFRYLVGSHAVFYRKVTAGIEIVRVLHQRMDFDRHL